jgi:N4-gp56 family major capsid protein
LEISQFGDTVKINAIGAIQVFDYTKNTDFSAGPQTLDDVSAMLTIEKSRAFNFFMDDIDKAQTKPKLMESAMQEAAYAMQNDVDAYIAARIVSDINAPATGTGNGYNIIGSDGTPQTIGTGAGETNAYEQLVDVSVALDTVNIPPDGRFAIVPPWFYGMLLKDQRFVSFGTPANRGTLMNAEVGEAAGIRILRSNNVPNTSLAKYKIIAGHPMATTFASQISSVEAYRPEKRFGDAAKGLNLYGAKCLRPGQTVLVTANKGT